MIIKVLFVACCTILIKAGAEHNFPNYITEEEFKVAREKPLVASNSTILLLPPHDQATLPHPRPGFGPRLWTNSQVPYTLDTSFNAEQREAVAQALDAYHRDTCIRFIPREAHHSSWVDILHDPSVCGVAHVCMNSGAQFAKFGGSCVNAGTMVHELGHTLCMGHEQTRLDRDKWIGFNPAVCEPHGIDNPDFNRGLHKLYDYVSVEHYEGECYNGCFQPKVAGVTKCGSGGPLAVLDLEILNELYNCGGCTAYRFINPANGLNAPLITGSEPGTGDLFTCRAYHGGDIIPGKYNPQTGTCYVGHNGGEYAYKTDLEVLCSPHGANIHWISGPTSPPPNSIRGGRSNERETLFIVQCQLTLNGQPASLPGKYQRSAGAYTSYGGQELRCDSYYFLACS